MCKWKQWRFIRAFYNSQVSRQDAKTAKTNENAIVNNGLKRINNLCSSWKMGVFTLAKHELERQIDECQLKRECFVLKESSWRSWGCFRD